MFDRWAPQHQLPYVKNVNKDKWLGIESEWYHQKKNATLNIMHCQSIIQILEVHLFNVRMHIQAVSFTFTNNAEIFEIKISR